MNLYSFYQNADKFSEQRIVQKCIAVATARAFPDAPSIGDYSDIDNHFDKNYSFYDFICQCYKKFLLYGDCVVYSYKADNLIKFASLNPISFFIENKKLFYFDQRGQCRKLPSSRFVFISNSGGFNRGSGAAATAAEFENALNRINEIELKKSVERSKVFIKIKGDNPDAAMMKIGGDDSSSDNHLKSVLDADMKVIRLAPDQEVEVFETPVEQQQYRYRQIIKQICLAFGVDYFLVTGDSSAVTERTYRTQFEVDNDIINQNLQLYFAPILRFIASKLNITPDVKFAELRKQNLFLYLKSELLKQEIQSK